MRHNAAEQIGGVITTTITLGTYSTTFASTAFADTAVSIDANTDGGGGSIGWLDLLLALSMLLLFPTANNFRKRRA